MWNVSTSGKPLFQREFFDRFAKGAGTEEDPSWLPAGRKSAKSGEQKEVKFATSNGTSTI